MPRDAITLADVREQTIVILCESCKRRGRCNVERLIAKHDGGMRLRPPAPRRTQEWFADPQQAGFCPLTALPERARGGDRPSGPARPSTCI